MRGAWQVVSKMLVLITSGNDSGCGETGKSWFGITIWLVFQIAHGARGIHCDYDYWYFEHLSCLLCQTTLLFACGVWPLRGFRIGEAKSPSPPDQSNLSMQYFIHLTERPRRKKSTYLETVLILEHLRAN